MSSERPGARSAGSDMTVVFLLLLALMATLSSGCVPSVPLPGPGDGGSVFVHPVTGEVKHCEDAGMPANFRGGVLWRRLPTPPFPTPPPEHKFLPNSNPL